MPANILNFDEKLPEAIYWDSSFILNFCIDGAKFFKECAKFVRRLESEKTTSIISTLILDEVWYGLLRANLINDFGGDWHDEIRENPEILKKYIPTLKRVMFDLSLLSNLILVEVSSETTLSALEFMENYSLFPRDAIHLSTCNSLGLKNIVTTDLDFIRVDGINVFTCNPDAFSLK